MIYIAENSEQDQIFTHDSFFLKCVTTGTQQIIWLDGSNIIDARCHPDDKLVPTLLTVKFIMLLKSVDSLKVTNDCQEGLQAIHRTDTYQCNSISSQRRALRLSPSKSNANYLSCAVKTQVLWLIIQWTHPTPFHQSKPRYPWNRTILYKDRVQTYLRKI